MCFWGENLIFVWKDPKVSRQTQNGAKWSKTTDHLGLFRTFLEHIGTLASLPCLSTFSPTWAISNSPCAHHRWMAMSKIASKERIFKVSVFVAVTSKNVKKRLKYSPNSVCERASQFEWMVKGSSGRIVWILCLSTSWFLRSSSCENVSSFILLVVRRWDLYIVLYICYIYGTLKQRRAKRNLSV